MTDAKNRTDTVTMETGPFICPRCKEWIQPFTLEEIAGITQLRAGKGLIQRVELSCLTPDCGCAVSWNIREQKIEMMTATYKQLIDLYKPE